MTGEKKKRQGRPASPLQREALRANWDKLLVKGAMGHLRKVLRTRGLGEGRAISSELASYYLSDLEAKMLAAIEEDYARIKALEVGHEPGTL